MVSTLVVYCDICREPGATGYRVGVRSEAWSVDLCPTHAEPLLAIARQGRSSLTPVAPIGNSTRNLESRIRVVG